MESPARKRKREQPSVPVRRVLVESVVERSPAAAVRKVSKRGTSYAVDDATVIGMCAAILLHHSNKHMNLVQRIISSLLYSGLAPKQV